VLQQATVTHELAKHCVEGARANTHSIAKQQQLRPAQHSVNVTPCNAPLPLMRPLKNTQRLAFGNQVALARFARNPHSQVTLRPKDALIIIQFNLAGLLRHQKYYSIRTANFRDLLRFEQ
jgi:hypothetical protein